MSELSDYTVVCVDDQLDYLDSVEQKATERGLNVKVTCHAEESLRLVEENNASELIADLRMPGMGGLDIFSKLVGKRSIKMTILTGFVPTQDENNLAREYGVTIRRKQQLSELLDDVAQRCEEAQKAGRNITTHAKSATHQVIVEARSLLTGYLESMKNLNDQTIFYRGKSFTVREMIQEVEEKTEIGEEHLALFLRVMRRSMGIK